MLTEVTNIIELIKKGGQTKHLALTKTNTIALTEKGKLTKDTSINDSKYNY